jgi:hypothetical protein
MSVVITTNGAQVAREIDRISRKNYYRIAAAVPELGERLREEWKSNATETAGEHGKWYPNAIISKRTGALEVTVGPTPGRRQGAMSFEFGSVNQPPHLDGTRAATAMSPIIRRRLEAILAF